MLIWCPSVNPSLVWAALIFLEMRDIIFAVDSVPAIFAKVGGTVDCVHVERLRDSRVTRDVLSSGGGYRAVHLLKGALRPDSDLRRLEDDVVERCLRWEVPDRVVTGDYRVTVARRGPGVAAANAGANGRTSCTVSDQPDAGGGCLLRDTVGMPRGRHQAARVSTESPPISPPLVAHGVENMVADRAFSRAAGALLIPGNAVRLLRDAQENYPAWLQAIASARRHVHFESYIVHDDRQGRRFAEALIAKAREGVAVRVLYDWLGATVNTSRAYWKRLRKAGIEVRAFNPLQVLSPLGWISRDHRKVLTVDGQLAYVTGLCVGDAWVGDPEAGREPWRDTGIELRGPAVAEVERAFARAWATAGPPLPPDSAPVAAAGTAPVRVIATEPSTGGVYRLDKLVAALARQRLWLTDAYFIGGSSYVQALIGAARDGVDVRLLVPGASDLPVVRAMSRAGYRALLEGGIRVFEWNGTMLHAKTAVADGYWSRVGSTNLNPVSWLGNWELDVAVEDKPFAQQMEEMFLRDLDHSTEIVLARRSTLTSTDYPEPASHRARVVSGRATRAVAGVVGIGNVIGSAITKRRALGPAESILLLVGGVLLLALAALAYMYPRAIALPFAVLGAWVGLGLLVRAYRLRVRSGSVPH